jgi:hypothetical protein
MLMSFSRRYGIFFLIQDYYRNWELLYRSIYSQGSTSDPVNLGRNELGNLAALNLYIQHVIRIICW